MSQENKYVDRPGTYFAKVKMPGNGWFGEAGAKKTPFIRIPLIITEDGSQFGREIVWRGYLSSATAERTIKTLAKVFDWDGDLKKLTFGHEDEDDSVFVGKHCKIVCEEEEYEGKTLIRARWLNALAKDDTMDKAKVASLVDKLNALSKKAAADAAEESDEAPASKRKSVSKKPAEKYEGRTKDDEGDEIPF